VQSLARADQPAQHHGLVLQIEASVFAPDPLTLRDYRSGACDGAAFARRYTFDMRARWRRERQAFLDAIALATGGNVLTLVDDFGDVPHAPHRLLGAMLKQLARQRRDRERRLERLARAEAMRQAVAARQQRP
jgi:hypothetical protein